MELNKKLEILADAAKYDASCASSGAQRSDSRSGKGVGSTGGAGICHSYAPDGRCISLLKLLLTNSCIYDCHYCINRRSSNVRRAFFTADEVVKLTLDFYKRNYIEGLFLSSGIIRNADYTMEQVIAVAKTLRETHDFRGYIHLKTIPEASPELIEEAARYADRISINMELPTQKSLDLLAPEKNMARTKIAMGRIRQRLDDARAQKKDGNRKLRHATGQSTQVIVGADESTDADFLAGSDELYNSYKLKRVYYSAFSPIPEPSSILPLKAPPLIREHRLYQADWLMRFYGFKTQEILSPEQPFLDLELDPKLAWALRNRHDFPVNLQTAPKETLLRVPGLGVRNVARIIQIRRHTKIRLADLSRLRVSLSKVMPFLITADHNPSTLLLDSDRLRAKFAPKPQQLELFT
ncbi:MAG: putative DNA modification/repair radical SAM protein [Akkermansiaceae bacterium]|nr:putative DNA modification/repair radical SAM protein [Akkermansiaceae bacterium]MDP4645797.1 putative DNA modification/repair radical SAM protein [Akkermansiaceae bacterium]MDP4779030.1 putative DNA modification/repair radical SAM protein [Akkermansiaceae bacterium]MDP4847966.1 putative DNA modification/repair radical SAM protein [Akkermansiaceae bacterium]MDP4896575.1 putative DNA modification/repair radical SAM protein [Akkermansiaceae bacterium]